MCLFPINSRHVPVLCKLRLERFRLTLAYKQTRKKMVCLLVASFRGFNCARHYWQNFILSDCCCMQRKLLLMGVLNTETH